MKVDLIARAAAEMYESGMSIEQVAAELGVAYRTARKAIRMAGVENRGPSERLIGRTRPDKAAERAEAMLPEVEAEPAAWIVPVACAPESLTEPLVGDPWLSGDEQMETSLSSVTR
jgi:predicted transcriptional regulator